MSALCRRITGLVSQMRIPLLAAIEQSKPAMSVPLSLPPCLRMKSSEAKAPTVNDRLMEFFDDSKNWEADTIKCGRSWKKDELRIKSNEDLHKLWFVLLKERNMLLTMEHEFKRECHMLPNPERIDKVEESMENLEAVVRERNRAYFELETTEPAERPGRFVTNEIGMRYFYRSSEHLIPKIMNRSFRDKVKFGYNDRSVVKFLRLLREKTYNKHAWIRHSKRRDVSNIFRQYPDVDVEDLREAYPDVDIEKARDHKDALGNHEKNIA